MVTETDRNKARSAVVSAYNTLDCVTIPFSFLHAFADAAVDAVSTDAEPVAYRHTLHMELDQNTSLLRESPQNPFGIPGKDYSEEYRVTTEPLYAEPVKTAPAVAVNALPLAAVEKRNVDEVDVTGWGVLEGHAIPFAVARGLAERINLCIHSALSAQVQDVAGWQPIETAPKDGSEILLYREDCGVILGRWISCSDFVIDGDPSAEFCQSDEEWEEPDWFGADFVSGFRITNDGLPTHWMPLPASPASKHGDVE